METWRGDGYAGLAWGEAAFLLQRLDEPVFAQHLMLKLEVEDLDAWWAAIQTKALEARYPGVRLRPPTEFPWGREVHLIDLAGVCWHVAALAG